MHDSADSWERRDLKSDVQMPSLVPQWDLDGTDCQIRAGETLPPGKHWGLSLHWTELYKNGHNPTSWVWSFPPLHTASIKRHWSQNLGYPFPNFPWSFRGQPLQLERNASHAISVSNSFRVTDGPEAYWKKKWELNSKWHLQRNSPLLCCRIPLFHNMSLWVWGWRKGFRVESRTLLTRVRDLSPDAFCAVGLWLISSSCFFAF